MPRETPTFQRISRSSVIWPCGRRPILTTTGNAPPGKKEDAIRYANTSLLENLLPLLDNFELGL